MSEDNFTVKSNRKKETLLAWREEMVLRAILWAQLLAKDYWSN